MNKRNLFHCLILIFFIGALLLAPFFATGKRAEAGQSVEDGVYGTDAQSVVDNVYSTDIVIISGSRDKVAQVAALDNPRVYAPLDYNQAEGSKVAGARFILLEMLADMGNYRQFIEEAVANGASVAQFGCLDNQYNNINEEDLTYISSYWHMGGTENMQNLISYIENKFLNEDVTFEPPAITPSAAPCGIYHPAKSFVAIPEQESVVDWIYSDPGLDYYGNPNWLSTAYTEWAKTQLPSLINEYKQWYENEYQQESKLHYPWLGVISYDPNPAVDAIVYEAESRGYGVISLYSSGSGLDGTSLIDAVYGDINANISLRSFFLKYPDPAAGVETLSRLDAETIKGVTLYSQTLDEYRQSNWGPQFEWVWQVVTPELEGIFSPVLVSAKSEDGMQDVPVTGGVKKIVDMAINWAELKEKSNEDKKVAIVLYNYPPGKSNFGASYLDVFQSVHDLLVRMKEEGYTIPEVPEPEELYNILSKGGNVGTWARPLLEKYVLENRAALEQNGQLVPVSEYEKWFEQLPEILQQEVEERWGAPPGGKMVYDGKIVIPGLMLGNVFITLQPSRGWEEVESYHDSHLPPHHQYIAFYNWLSESWGADAMVHMGTHGTLEWLPGRQTGLLEDDWPHQLTTLPNIYPYIVSNPGEGLVAKYRSYALIVDHMTPAMVQSGLYGEMLQLQALIQEYDDAVRLGAMQNIPNLEKQILLVAGELGFTKDEQEDFATWLEEIHDQLQTINRDRIPLGLHVLGQGLEGDKLIEELLTIAMTRTTLLENIAAQEGLDYQALAGNPGGYNSELGKYNSELLDEIDGQARDYLRQLIDGVAPERLTSDKDLLADLIVCRDTMNKLIINEEIDSVIKALGGRYVKPGMAGDPAWYDETLPTGRNFYSGDPTKMPTRAAWETGKQIASSIIEKYKAATGDYPETVGIVIWGTEVLRTNGVSLATVLSLLGTKPVWNKYDKVTGVELTPLEELGRPRIDVVVTVAIHCKEWVDLINQAVKLAAEADEYPGENMVKKHYQEIGSLHRVFGLPEGVLEGTGVNDLVPNTGRWNSTGELADVYLSRMCNAYGETVEKDKETFKYLLERVSVVTQPMDSTWRFLDTDDFYDWFGGMMLASKYLGGNPQGLIADIRDPKNMQIRDLQEEIELEVRSQLLNPKYMESLLNTTSGWFEYAKRYANLFGTEATTGIVSDSLWNLVSQNLLQLEITKDYEAFAMQDMLGWSLEAARRGMWNASPEMLQELSNKYVEMVARYGVVCCHHTCSNIVFNEWLANYATVDSDTMDKFKEVFYQSTDKKLNISQNQDRDRDHSHHSHHSHHSPPPSTPPSSPEPVEPVEPVEPAEAAEPAEPVELVEPAEAAEPAPEATVEEQEPQNEPVSAPLVGAGEESSQPQQLAQSTTPVGEKPAPSGIRTESKQLKKPETDRPEQGQKNVKAYEIKEKSAQQSSSTGRKAVSFIALMAALGLVAFFARGYFTK